MRFTVALGGFLGFAFGVIGGLVGGRDPGSMLLQATLACVVGGVLFRWLHGLFLRSVAVAYRERQEAERQRRRERNAQKRASSTAAAGS